MSVEQFSVNSISNPADREKLMKVISECSNALVRIQGERDYIKEAVTEISKKFQIPKRLLNRLIRTYYKQNFDEEVAVSEQFQELYEQVIM